MKRANVTHRAKLCEDDTAVRRQYGWDASHGHDNDSCDGSCTVVGALHEAPARKGSGGRVEGEGLRCLFASVQFSPILERSQENNFVAIVPLLCFCTWGNEPALPGYGHTGSARNADMRRADRDHPSK